jgi:hypothetical protein
MTVGLLTAGAVVGWSLAIANERTLRVETNAVSTAPVAKSGRESQLVAIDWLVGDWVDASNNASVEFSCHFTKNGAFLVRSFRIINAKDVQLSGMQLIAWDPVRKAIRSWTFDSEGGFGEETWRQSGKRYAIRSKYTLPDGGTGSNMQIVTFIDNNKFTWKSVNRDIDGELLPDTDEIVLIRKPSTDDAKGAK